MATTNSKQDIPVIIHNGKRGLLSIEDGVLDVLQLSSDGRPPKRLLSCPVRLLLRARLSPPVPVPADFTSDVTPNSSAFATPRSSISMRKSLSATRRSSLSPRGSTSGSNAPAGTRKLDIHALVQKGAKSNHLHYTKIRVLVEPTHAADAEAWVEQLMAAAYPVSKPYRRVLLIVNPIGGKGKGVSLAKSTIVPILEAAGCTVDMRVTEYRPHGEEIVKEVDLSKIDVIAVASGDGGVYEVLNGLASRPDARRALRVPISPLPTGSACACCTNLFGPKNNFNIPLATLNVIKGQPMDIDLQSVLLLPSRERHLSFLSVATGLMVDLDIGTEHLRWMGDTRFVYGFLRGVVTSKACKARLRIDIIEDDKEVMAEEARAAALKERGMKTVGGGTDPLAIIQGVQTLSLANAEPSKANGVSVTSEDRVKGKSKAVESESEAEANGAVPQDGLAPRKASDDSAVCESAMPMSPALSSGGTSPAKPSTPAPTQSAPLAGEGDPLPPARELVPTDSWITVESNAPRKGSRPDTTPNTWAEGDMMLYLYSGLMPYVSRDLNQWPVARPGSGAIELVVQRVVGRGTLFGAVTDGANGDQFWFESQNYYKVRAYTLENLDKKGQPTITLDGEAYDWDTCHVEVLARAARLLTLDGRFFQGEFVNKDPKAGAGK